MTAESPLESLTPSDDIDTADSLQEAIYSITSASQGPIHLDTVDAKLQSFLSVRAYDAIVLKSQSEAQGYYAQILKSDLNGLIQNHEMIEKEFGTAGDTELNWRVDPQGLDENALQREIRRVRRKIARIEEEIAELERYIPAKRERLGLILSQNGKLARVRDS